MARTEAPKDTGRLPIEINPQVVEAMAYSGATKVDIAAFVGCSVDTIDRRFAAEFDKGKARRKLKLRQLQWKFAERGNAALLIFLGKAELGQKETIVNEHQLPDGSAPIPTRFEIEIVKPRRSGGRAK